MITHTPKPRITSSGFIPDDDTRRNDEAHAKRTAQLAEEQAAIERNARRYLALRDSGVYLEPGAVVCVVWEDLDAAADRLLEGGE